MQEEESLPDHDNTGLVCIYDRPCYKPVVQIFINNALERFNGSPIDSVVCCNTLNTPVSRISVAELVAEAIKDAYAGKW